MFLSKLCHILGSLAVYLVVSATYGIELPRSTGYNFRGLLGNGAAERSLVPVEMDTDVAFTRISGGNYHALAIDGSGLLYGWGDGSQGCLGPTGQVNPTPFPLFGTGKPLGSEVAEVAGGYCFTVALLKDGRVVSFGLNDRGQLGDGTFDGRPTAALVPLVQPAISTAAGDFHALACDSTGMVFAWGQNSSGQLGNGSTAASSTPVAVAGLNSAVAVAASRNHSVALLADGRVATWGENTSYQLGDGTAEARSIPYVIVGLGNVRAICASAGGCAALRQDGTVWGWGGFFSRYPELVPGLASVKAMAAGLNHFAFLLEDGSVRTLGESNEGQLGDGQTERRSQPVSPVGLPEVASVGASSLSTYFSPSGVPIILDQKVEGVSYRTAVVKIIVKTEKAGHYAELYLGNKLVGTKVLTAGSEPSAIEFLVNNLSEHTQYDAKIITKNAAGLVTDRSSRSFATLNSNPVLQASTVKLSANGTGSLTLAQLSNLVQDAGGDTEFTYAIAGVPANGTVRWIEGETDGRFEFEPSEAWAQAGQGNFSLRVQDAFGGTSEAVIFQVRDTLAPILEQAETPPLDFSEGSLAPDLTLYFNASDNAPGVIVVQTPAAGSEVPLGLSHVIVTARDAAGNKDMVNLSILGKPLEPAFVLQGKKGDLLPTGPNNNFSGSYQRFANPSISRNGGLAFKAWAKVRTDVEQSILVNGELVAQQNDQVPGLTPPTFFKSFGEPVLSPAGAVAFTAKTSTKGSAASEQLGIFTATPGTTVHQILSARSSSSLLLGAKIETIEQLAIDDSGIYVLAKLSDKAARRVLAKWTPTLGLQALVSTRSQIAVGEELRRVVSLDTLQSATTVSGQGRNLSAGTISIRLGLDKGAYALATVDSAGILRVALTTEQQFVGKTSAGATVTGFLREVGVPAHAVLKDGKVAMAVRSVLRTSDVGDGRRQSGIFLLRGREEVNAVIAHVGDSIANGSTSAFASLQDPILTAQPESGTLAAFVGKIVGPGVSKRNDEAVFFGLAEAHGPALLLQEGDIAPETGGATISKVESLALPAWEGAKPLALVQLTPNNSAFEQPARALLTFDAASLPVVVLRDGQSIQIGEEKKIIRSFKFLPPVPGSLGQVRSFNDRHIITVHVTFKDLSECVLTCVLP